MFLKNYNESGHIYESEIVQFYCNNDKKFLPDRYVIGTMSILAKQRINIQILCEKCGRVPEEIIEILHCSLFAVQASQLKKRLLIIFSN